MPGRCSSSRFAFPYRARSSATAWETIVFHKFVCTLFIQRTGCFRSSTVPWNHCSPGPTSTLVLQTGPFTFPVDLAGNFFHWVIFQTDRRYVIMTRRVLEEWTIIWIYKRNIFGRFAFPLGVNDNSSKEQQHQQSRQDWTFLDVTHPNQTEFQQLLYSFIEGKKEITIISGCRIWRAVNLCITSWLRRASYWGNENVNPSDQDILSTGILVPSKETTKSNPHKAGVLNLALRAQNSSQSNSPYSGNYSAIFLHFFLLHMIYL